MACREIEDSADNMSRNEYLNSKAGRAEYADAE